MFIDEEKINILTNSHAEPGEISTRNTNDPPPDTEEDDKDKKSTGPRPWPPLENRFEAQRLFACLIAIDHYEVPGANLGGCVQDSLAVEKYLRETAAESGQQLHLLKLRSPLSSMTVGELSVDAPAATSTTEGKPTRRGIIEAFQGFLSQAGERDAVFVHYSGHGSFEQRPEQLWHLDAEESSEHRAETLVCQDSYTTQNGEYIPALRDKELRWLLAQVAERKPHIVLVMDCCNSSGNTRLFEEGIKVRYTASKTAQEKNGIGSYVFYQQDTQTRALLDQNPSQFSLPEGRHTALYACHSYQLAKETRFPEGRHGVFTYFLLQTLRASRGNISYRDLIKLVRAKAGQSVENQSPQRHSTIPEDADLVFLGGATSAHRDAYTVRAHETAGKGILDAGSLHGLPDPASGKTWLTVFPADTPTWQVKPNEGLRGYLEKVGPEESVLVFADGGSYPTDEPFLKAIVTATPLEKTRVCIETEVEQELVDVSASSKDATLQRLADVKARLIAALADHPHLEVVEKSAANWQYRLFAYVYQGLEKLRITEKDKVAAMVTPKIGFSETAVQGLVKDMAHIARWARTLNLENVQNTVIRPGEVSLDVLDGNGKLIQDHHGEIVLKAAAPGEPKPKLKFKAVLHNPHQVPLYCALIHIKPDFSVAPGLLPDDAHLGKVEFLEGASRIKREQYEIYAGSHVPINGQTNPDGLYLSFSLPESTGDLEITEVTDHFKLIVSTEQFDALHLWQPALQRAGSTRAGRDPELDSALDHLLHEVQTRDAGWHIVAEEPPPQLTDWWTTLVSVKTVR